MSYFPAEVTLSDVDGYPIESAVLPAPVFAAGEHYAVQQGAGMVVTKSDPQTEYAATVFLRWFTETERNIAFCVSSGYLPVKNEALDLEKIFAVLDQDEDAANANRMKQAFAAALTQIAESTLYTSRAFGGGTEARNIVENSLADRCAADRAAVLAALEAGQPEAEALAPYLSEEHFQTWCQDLLEQLGQL